MGRHADRRNCATRSRTSALQSLQSLSEKQFLVWDEQFSLLCVKGPRRSHCALCDAHFLWYTNWISINPSKRFCRAFNCSAGHVSASSFARKPCTHAIYFLYKGTANVCPTIKDMYMRTYNKETFLMSVEGITILLVIGKTRSICYV